MPFKVGIQQWPNLGQSFEAYSAIAGIDDPFARPSFTGSICVPSIRCGRIERLCLRPEVPSHRDSARSSRAPELSRTPGSAMSK
jgi:hypothetical protein